jgi:ribosome maturation factor RimP
MRAEVEDIVRRVEALATPVVAEEGMEIWGVDFRPEAGRWVLRLALDRNRGVTLDELTRVHRQLNDLFDVHDPVPWRYTLEVSSPGITRSLLRPPHYRRYEGSRIRVQTRLEQQGRRTFMGVLRAVKDDGILLVDDLAGEVQMEWGNIRKATNEHEFPAPQQHKGKRRPH